MDDAANTAGMRIGELADRAGVSAKTIRYYEQVGLLPDPARIAAGYRIYGRADAERVGFIKGARRLGLALGEIAEILALRDHGRAPCDYVCDLLARRHADLDHAIAQLTE